jgi:hypothetical protein
VIATCATAGVTAHVDKKLVELGASTFIPFGESTNPTRMVIVEFTNAKGELVATKQVTVRYNETKTATCDPS